MPDRTHFKPRNSLGRPSPPSQSSVQRSDSSPPWSSHNGGIKRKRTLPSQSGPPTFSSFLSSEQISQRPVLGHEKQKNSLRPPSKGESRFKNLIRLSTKTSPRKEESSNTKSRHRSPSRPIRPPEHGSRHSSSPPKSNKVQVGRKALPIWGFQEHIARSLKERDVLILVGETGSGKSTQVPQFLLKQAWCKSRKVETLSREGSHVREIEVGGCIAVTEPRRVAAISLAHRVASEMGETLGQGSMPGRVGYSVRFDSKVSSKTRIKFLTEGMLLQELLRDPWLKQYSAVVVDEIHERGVNVDLVAGFLKNIVSGKKEGRGGISLKIAIMSATADMESLQRFFESSSESRIYSKDDLSAAHNQNGAQNLVNGSKSNLTLRKEVDRSVLLTNGYHSDNDQRESDVSADSPSWSGISSSDDANEDSNTARIPKIISSISNGEQANSVGHVEADSRKLNHAFSFNKSDSSLDPHSATNTEKGKGMNGIKNTDSQSESEHILPSSAVSTLHIEGRQYPVKVLYAEEPVHDFVDAALRTIFQIHYGESLPGDVLVFLTGQDDIETLDKLVTDHASAMGPGVPKVCYLPGLDFVELKIFCKTDPVNTALCSALERCTAKDISTHSSKDQEDYHCHQCSRDFHYSSGSALCD